MGPMAVLVVEAQHRTLQETQIGLGLVVLVDILAVEAVETQVAVMVNTVAEAELITLEP